MSHSGWGMTKRSTAITRSLSQCLDSAEAIESRARHVGSGTDQTDKARDTEGATQESQNCTSLRISSEGLAHQEAFDNGKE